MRPLVIINPNSTQAVTQGISEAIEPLSGYGVPFRCLTLTEGPPAIENQMQADLTIGPMLNLAAAQTDAAGFVIACFGDPGLHALRVATGLPVLGIQESAVSVALTLGHRFGVIAILAASIPRHLRAFGAMGVLDRLAGDRALGLRVEALLDEEKSLEAMIRTGCLLRDQDGADVLIMGCAGMAAYRDVLEQETGLPVIEPCQAAVALALGQITLGYGQTKTGKNDA